MSYSNVSIEYNQKTGLVEIWVIIDVHKGNFRELCIGVFTTGDGAAEALDEGKFTLITGTSVPAIRECPPKQGRVKMSFLLNFLL